MNSQRPAALADMFTIMAVRDHAVHAGPDCAAPYSRPSGARRRHAKVAHVPPVQPQPVLAPLTPAAIFLVVTIDDGGEATVHDALPDLSGLVRAIGFRDPTKHLSVVDLDRLGCLGPVVRRASLDKARRTASVRRADGTAARRARHARRPAFPYSGRNAGCVFRVGRPHPQVDGRCGDRGRRSARLQVLRQPRPAGFCRRHRKPGRPNRCERHRDRRRGSRLRRLLLRPRAEVPARHDSRGNPCQSPSRSK